MNQLKAGDKAPEFIATDETGQTIRLTDFQGRKLIIFFYPKADTPGCTTESCNLRDNYKKLKDSGFEIIGISADSIKQQQKFKNKYSFPYPLIPDSEKIIINKYGVWGLKNFMGKEYYGILRKTFIINEEGEIALIIDQVNTENHSAQILELLSL